ncbi:PGPGW domain-containing protein [Rubinisphaera margarita]|uniref:PGPGW domain-containing protein n=1 Tax=Rubinisphaera margarita TaxID=2909586 RepID=UPI001EE9A2EC|nr:PGPGW domain-containing protein [Rubinisphaera margarita]MCG6156415.1 PGPGW domain-containing protein [Rubinisphaera margarita]
MSNQVKSSSWQLIRQIAVGIAGGIVILLGGIMLVTPGPGLVMIAVGLAILGTEFVWARHLRNRVQKYVREKVDNARNRKRDSEQKSKSPAETSRRTKRLIERDTVNVS